jgi:hypothetical protein
MQVLDTPTPLLGLTQAEATLRLQRDGPNQIVIDGPANPEIFQPLTPGVARAE